MKVYGTITFSYDISDDPAERERTYGTRDPEACAVVDQGNDPFELLATVAHADLTLKLTTEPQVRTTESQLRSVLDELIDAPDCVALSSNQVLADRLWSQLNTEPSC